MSDPNGGSPLEHTDVFQQLYDTQYPLVLARCRKALRDPEDAEDVTQEVFLAIHTHLKDFKFRSTAATWVHMITTNKIRDRIRRNLCQPQTVHIEEYTEGEHTTPASQLFRAELSQAVSRIPERDQVLLRQIVSGKDTRSIAEDAGCQEKTVRIRLGKIRKDLYGKIYTATV